MYDRQKLIEVFRQRALKFGVRTRLVPHLHALGFERIGTKANRARWLEEPPGGFAFGRVRGETADLLDVYWDKYGSPKFVIDLWIWPALGWLLRNELIPSVNVATPTPTLLPVMATTGAPPDLACY